jgi:hypothetical protein
LRKPIPDVERPFDQMNWVVTAVPDNINDILAILFSGEPHRDFSIEAMEFNHVRWDVAKSTGSGRSHLSHFYPIAVTDEGVKHLPPPLHKSYLKKRSAARKALRRYQSNQRIANFLPHPSR